MFARPHAHRTRPLLAPLALWFLFPSQLAAAHASIPWTLVRQPRASVRPRLVCRCHITYLANVRSARSPKDCDGLSRFISTTRHFPASLAAVGSRRPRPGSLSGPTVEGVQVPEEVLLIYWGRITWHALREILKPETMAASLRTAPGRRGGRSYSK